MKHIDPPVDPKKFGWGDPELHARKNLAIEWATVEHLAAAKPKLAMDTAGVRGGSQLLPGVEAAIRAQFKFDEGWDMMVAERMVYRLSASETLMINQNIGNCVGASHCALLASRIAHEILAEGDAEDPLGTGRLAMPFMPYSYGCGRWAGNMLGPGDGSYCGAQIEGTMEHGFLPCFTSGLETYAGSGESALPQGTANAGRLFGRSKSEIQKWTDKAAQFDLLEAPRAKNVEDCWDLIVNKKTPLQICSGWAFKYKGFDEKYGVHLYRPGGSWSHSMQLPMAFRIKGQEFYTIRNQWSLSAHKGSPEIGVSGGCMVIAAEDMARWVKDSETIGIGAIQGLPANPGF